MKETDQICVESQNILKKQFIEMNDLSTTEGNHIKQSPWHLMNVLSMKKKTTCEVIFMSLLFQDR